MLEHQSRRRLFSKLCRQYPCFVTTKSCTPHLCTKVMPSKVNPDEE
uniref:Uncharacterized protein n=1 Tax=Arundo donax TaxID=35708 RepID=A0A0A9EMY5_ARUDO